MDVLINLNPASTVPLHRQVYEELRRAILSGRLPKGKRVPSTREMAKTLGVARATVTLAYDYLLSEGYLQAYKGSGTYVSKHLPDELTDVSAEMAEEAQYLAEEELSRIEQSGTWSIEQSGTWRIVQSGVMPSGQFGIEQSAAMPSGQSGIEQSEFTARPQFGIEQIGVALGPQLGIEQSGVTSSPLIEQARAAVDPRQIHGTSTDSKSLSPPPQKPSGGRRSRKLSLYGQALQSGDWLGYPDDEPEIQFAFGRPDLEHFPMRIWSQLMSRHCRQRKLDLLDCPNKAAGYPPLRKAIATYIARARAVECEPEQVIIVNGSQQALDLVNRVLIDPGDFVGIEEPGYIGAQKAFHAQGARLMPVYVDKHGVRTDYLKARFSSSAPEKLKVLYVTPSHQYPTGVVLSLPRRLELLSWVSRRGTIIVEDDYDSEYRYSGRPMPALAGIDSGGSVIYIGTFSKVLLPALRLGYVVVPKDLIDVFVRAKWLVDRHSSLLEQQVLADFIVQGHLSRHVRKMRAIYQERRKLVIELLKGLFEDDLTIYGENAGINILFRLKTELPDFEIVSRAGRLGVGIVSTRQLYVGAAPPAEFLLNYGGLKESEIVEGLSRLRAAVDRKALLDPEIQASV